GAASSFFKRILKILAISSHGCDCYFTVGDSVFSRCLGSQSSDRAHFVGSDFWFQSSTDQQKIHNISGAELGSSSSVIISVIIRLPCSSADCSSGRGWFGGGMDLCYASVAKQNTTTGDNCSKEHSATNRTTCSGSFCC